jgi:hypothetical protein
MCASIKTRKFSSKKTILKRQSLASPSMSHKNAKKQFSCEENPNACQQQKEIRNDDEVVEVKSPWGPTRGPWGHLPRVGKDDFKPLCLIDSSNALFKSEGVRFTHGHFMLAAMRKFWQEGHLFPPGTTAKDLVGTVEAAKFVFLQAFGRHRLYKVKVGNSLRAKISNILHNDRAKRFLVTGQINQRKYDVIAGQERHCCAVLPDAIVDINAGRRPRSAEVLRDIFQDISCVYGIID